MTLYNFLYDLSRSMTKYDFVGPCTNPVLEHLLQPVLNSLPLSPNHHDFRYFGWMGTIVLMGLRGSPQFGTHHAQRRQSLGQ